jgi:hypothetical protein
VDEGSRLSGAGSGEAAGLLVLDGASPAGSQITLNRMAVGEPEASEAVKDRRPLGAGRFAAAKPSLRASEASGRGWPCGSG